jgi:hypothetical protein
MHTSFNHNSNHSNNHSNNHKNKRNIAATTIDANKTTVAIFAQAKRTKRQALPQASGLPGRDAVVCNKQQQRSVVGHVGRPTERNRR